VGGLPPSLVIVLTLRRRGGQFSPRPGQINYASSGAGGTPHLGAFMKSDTAKWAKVIKEAGITAE
jgi:hypothetical protein